VRFRTIGEGDECTCAECRGVELPTWLWRLSERVEEHTDAKPGDRIR